MRRIFWFQNSSTFKESKKLKKMTKMTMFLVVIGVHISKKISKIKGISLQESDNLLIDCFREGMMTIRKNKRH